MGRPRKNPLPENEVKTDAVSINTTIDQNKVIQESLPDVMTARVNATDKTINITEEKNHSETVVVEMDKPKTDVPVGSEYNNIPPVVRKRNQYGFLENVNYVFNENGKVNWRAMIKDEFLVFNRDKKDEIERTYGKKLSELSVKDVDDKYLLIKLFGIRELASSRGFYSAVPIVSSSSDYKATVRTIIDWIGNNDTEMREESYGDVASASVENTNGFGKLFLESIAANRAFIRAVRNYLEIEIVGFDEVKSEKEEPNLKSSLDLGPKIEKAATALGLNFELFIKGVKDKYLSSIESDPTKWERYSDIPPSDAYRLLSILNTAIEEKKKVK